MAQGAIVLSFSIFIFFFFIIYFHLFFRRVMHFVPIYHVIFSSKVLAFLFFINGNNRPIGQKNANCSEMLKHRQGPNQYDSLPIVPTWVEHDRPVRWKKTQWYTHVHFVFVLSSVCRCVNPTYPFLLSAVSRALLMRNPGFILIIIIIFVLFFSFYFVYLNACEVFACFI